MMQRNQPVGHASTKDAVEYQAHQRPKDLAASQLGRSNSGIAPPADNPSPSLGGSQRSAPLPSPRGGIGHQHNNVLVIRAADRLHHHPNAPQHHMLQQQLQGVPTVMQQQYQFFATTLARQQPILASGVFVPPQVPLTPQAAPPPQYAPPPLGGFAPLSGFAPVASTSPYARTWPRRQQQQAAAAGTPQRQQQQQRQRGNYQQQQSQQQNRRDRGQRENREHRDAPATNRAPSPAAVPHPSASQGAALWTSSNKTDLEEGRRIAEAMREHWLFAKRGANGSPADKEMGAAAGKKRNAADKSQPVGKQMQKVASGQLPAALSRGGLTKMPTAALMAGMSTQQILRIYQAGQLAAAVGEAILSDAAGLMEEEETSSPSSAVEDQMVGGNQFKNLRAAHRPSRREAKMKAKAECAPCLRYTKLQKPQVHPARVFCLTKDTERNFTKVPLAALDLRLPAAPSVRAALAASSAKAAAATSTAASSAAQNRLRQAKQERVFVGADAANAAAAASKKQQASSRQAGAQQQKESLGGVVKVGIRTSGVAIASRTGPLKNTLLQRALSEFSRGARAQLPTAASTARTAATTGGQKTAGYGTFDQPANKKAATAAGAKKPQQQQRQQSASGGIRGVSAVHNSPLAEARLKAQRAMRIAANTTASALGVEATTLGVAPSVGADDSKARGAQRQAAGKTTAAAAATTMSDACRAALQQCSREAAQVGRIWCRLREHTNLQQAKQLGTTKQRQQQQQKGTTSSATQKKQQLALGGGGGGVLTANAKDNAKNHRAWVAVFKEAARKGAARMATLLNKQKQQAQKKKAAQGSQPAAAATVTVRASDFTSRQQQKTKKPLSASAFRELYKSVAAEAAKVGAMRQRAAAADRSTPHYARATLSSTAHHKVHLSSEALRKATGGKNPLKLKSAMRSASSSASTPLHPRIVQPALRNVKRGAGKRLPALHAQDLEEERRKALIAEERIRRERLSGVFADVQNVPTQLRAARVATHTLLSLDEHEALHRRRAPASAGDRVKRQAQKEALNRKLKAAAASAFAAPKHRAAQSKTPWRRAAWAEQLVQRHHGGTPMTAYIDLKEKGLLTPSPDSSPAFSSPSSSMLSSEAAGAKVHGKVTLRASNLHGMERIAAQIRRARQYLSDGSHVAPAARIAGLQRYTGKQGATGNLNATPNLGLSERDPHYRTLLQHALHDQAAERAGLDIPKKSPLLRANVARRDPRSLRFSPKSPEDRLKLAFAERERMLLAHSKQSPVPAAAKMHSEGEAKLQALNKLKAINTGGGNQKLTQQQQQGSNITADGSSSWKQRFGGYKGALAAAHGVDEPLLQNIKAPSVVLASSRAAASAFATDKTQQLGTGKSAKTSSLVSPTQQGRSAAVAGNAASVPSASQVERQDLAQHDKLRQKDAAGGEHLFYELDKPEPVVQARDLLAVNPHAHLEQLVVTAGEKAALDMQRQEAAQSRRCQREETRRRIGVRLSGQKALFAGPPHFFTQTLMSRF